ncbi:MAG: hypothetical protein FD161_2767 [Limisphaerales bacterium]|nr:MAG: hypothetical protein FD161_2767 [Limisphaerales bacterium]KAG0508265.1 MAG: hypothetical protein E1N63_2518 [Limisphaerales bacterium]TXT49580.1 MAG: hypothetical protein FD140_2906 [Limisphaerales bacterium]
MHTRTHSFAVFLPVGFIGAFITAFTFIAVIQLTLPPNDKAYGQGISKTLSDPFVTAIAAPVVLVSGALATPLLYFCLRHRRLAVALPIVFGSVLVTVAITTPLSQLFGLFSAFVALVVSCIVCTQIQATSYEGSHDAA